MTIDSKIEEFINKLKSSKENDKFSTFLSILNYVEKNCDEKHKKEYIPRIYKEAEKNFKYLKIEESIHILEKIVLIIPDYWQGFYSLGQIHLLNNNIKLANKSFAKVISLNPNNTNAIDEFGKTSFILGYTKNGVGYSMVGLMPEMKGKTITIYGYYRQEIDSLKIFVR